MGKISMRELVLQIAGNRLPHETMAEVLIRVAKTAGLHPRAVRQVWHREPNISLETARKLKAAAEKKQNETRNSIAWLESLAERLEKIDPELHCNDIAALRDLARQVGRVDRGAK